MLGTRKGKLQMINIDKNSIEFINTIHIGKRSDIESIINRVKNRFNSFIGSEVIHRNTHYVVRDVNVKSYNEKLAITIKLDLLNGRELIDIVEEIRNEVLEENANENT